MFSLESPHRDTQYTIFNIHVYKEKKIALNYPKSAAMGFFQQGLKERVRNNHGKRAISVRATEVLLYYFPDTAIGISV